MYRSLYFICVLVLNFLCSGPYVITISLIINQKDESQNGCYKKAKRQIFKQKKNEHFLPPDTHTNVYVSKGEKCLFFGRFCVLCFLGTPVLRFFLLLYYRQFMCTFFLQNLETLFVFYSIPLRKIQF